MSDFNQTLASQLHQGDDDAVRQLLDKTELSELSENEVNYSLDLVRQTRKFDILNQASSAMLLHGHETANVRLHQTQALIELGRFTQAESILDKFDLDTMDVNSRAEVIGRLGRLHKQKYVIENKRHDLLKSLEYYNRGWTEKLGDYRWHGINVVALMKNDSELSQDNKPSTIANQLLTEIKGLDNRNTWDCATAVEASLALSDNNGTLNWTKELIQHERADAFTLGSTLRQLREVWGIQNPLVNQIEPILEYEILQKQGGRVQVTPDHVTDTKGFQAIYGSNGATKVLWMENLFAKLTAVARILNAVEGNAVGTGFVIKASQISKELNDKFIFVTNSHVVNDLRDDPEALRPENAVAEFTRLDGRPKLKLGKKIFYSDKENLDVWICEIEQSDALTHIDVTEFSPVNYDESDPERIYVIGHPQGGDLSITLDNNDLVGYDRPYVHYKSPTERGSSGSPVLSRALEAFALHHKARDDLQVNQGVIFKEIMKEVEKKLTL